MGLYLEEILNLPFRRERLRTNPRGLPTLAKSLKYCAPCHRLSMAHCSIVATLPMSMNHPVRGSWTGKFLSVTSTSMKQFGLSWTFFWALCNLAQEKQF
jgi:hypothetical protein